MTVTNRIALLIALGSTACAGSAVAQEFKLVPLAGSASAGSRVYGVNSAGQAVGWSTISGDTKHATEWNSSLVRDLHGTLHFGLGQIFDIDYSESFAISDDDQIVGTARFDVKCGEEEIIHSHAFIFRPAVLSDLGTPYPGDALVKLGALAAECTGFDSAAVGISNRSHVVGWAELTGGDIHAFIVTPVNGSWYRDTVAPIGVNDLMVDLGTLDSRSTVSSATAVNDNGQVTGYSYTTTFTYNGDSAYHAFIVTPQGGSWFVDANADGINDLMQSIGTLGGPNSWGRAINNSGVIVGEADTASYDTHAFIYQNGQIADLGTLGGRNSSASGINNNGDVVGWAEDDTGARRAFLYKNGRFRDLNGMLLATDTGRVTLTEARDINDAGDIVGWGTTTNGTEQIDMAFRLRLPTDDEVAEADALLALQAGLVDGTTTDADGNSTGGGSNGGGSNTGTYIGGTPSTLDGTTDDGSDADADGGTDVINNAAGASCGVGFASLMPIMMLAMLGMRRR